jgi:hypothetical protein
MVRALFFDYRLRVCSTVDVTFWRRTGVWIAEGSALPLLTDFMTAAFLSESQQRRTVMGIAEGFCMLDHR